MPDLHGGDVFEDVSLHGDLEARDRERILRADVDEAAPRPDRVGGDRHSFQQHGGRLP